MSNSTQTTPLAGKAAFVQGGSRGIGAAIVQRLARDGAAVAFTYASSAQKAEELASRIEAAGGRVLAIKADSADAEQLKAAVDQAAAHFGRLDILVNNAGVLAVAPLEDFSLEDFDRTVAVNVRSVFVASQAAARHLGEGGRIITIGSTNAERMPFAGGGVYAMSKAAVTGLTRGFARDLGPRGITVNTVQPGPVDTRHEPGQRRLRRIAEADDGPGALRPRRRDRFLRRLPGRPGSRLYHRRQPDDRRRLRGLRRRAATQPGSGRSRLWMFQCSALLASSAESCSTCSYMRSVSQ